MEEDPVLSFKLCCSIKWTSWSCMVTLVSTLVSFMVKFQLLGRFYYCLHGKISSIKLRRSSSNCPQLSSYLQNKIRLLDMLLIFTAVLFLISMPTHEASRFFQREDQNMINKNHLLESSLKAGQVPPSSISQKTFAGHCLSFATPSPSICTQSGYLYPWSKNQSKNLYDPQQCSFARFNAEVSSASPCAQLGDCHPLARWPASKISRVSRILRISNQQMNLSMNKQQQMTYDYRPGTKGQWWQLNLVRQYVLRAHLEYFQWKLRSNQMPFQQLFLYHMSILNALLSLTFCSEC